jgi:hypothetical protein
VLPSSGVPLIAGGVVFCGAAARAAWPEPARAPSADTTIVATPAPNAAPTATQRFLCMVFMLEPLSPVASAGKRLPRDAYNSLADG